MIEKDTIIIGGGASGLMCALSAIKNNKKVCILESAFKVGKKILVSGNGRCNFTNKNLNANCYNVFPKQFEHFNNFDTQKLFESIGLESYFDEEGRAYPISNHSSSVLDVLTNSLNNSMCEIITNCNVLNVKKENGKFLIETNSDVFVANKVVIATGGNTMQQTLKNFGIETTKIKPSLCGLKTSEHLQLLNGIRVNAVISIKVNNKTLKEKGEVLFRENGISGICVFNLSAKLNWLNCCGGQISINLMPEYTKSELINKLQMRKENLKKLNAKQFFDGWFHNNLGIEILNRCGINLKTKVEKLTKDNLTKMAQEILALTFNVVGFMDNNQVCSGGVALNELNLSLESKKIKNLFLCGEVVDVDGICGGYNLQWAWTSGYVVGENLWLK